MSKRGLKIVWLQYCRLAEPSDQDLKSKIKIHIS